MAELARDGRPLLVDLTDGAAVAAALSDVEDQITVGTGRAAGDVAAVPAKALLVRPDGYVAWASSADTPGAAEMRELRRALSYWFGC